MSTIVLNSLNYVGSGILNGVSFFYERAQGLVSAFSTLSNRINLTQDKSNILWKMVVPVVQAADSSCGCAGDVVRTTYVDINIRFEKTATAAERADVKKRIQDLVLTSQFVASIDSLVVAQ